MSTSAPADRTRLAAVVGHPVSHSRSPAIHNAGYAAVGLTGWVYQAIDVTTDQVPEFLAGLGPEWVGLSVTMPLKQAALAAATAGSSKLAATIGAANTLIRQPAGWYAENTDAPGMVDALRAAGWPGDHAGEADGTTGRFGRVTILGAGGTARAAVAAVAEFGVDEVRVLARRAPAVVELATVSDLLGVRVHHVPWSPPISPDPATSGEPRHGDLVINTLPAGVADELAIELGSGMTVFDVAYDPWPTQLASRAAAAGARVIGGLELLVAQAVRQFTLFTGVPAPVHAMRDAALNRVAEPTGPDHLDGGPCFAG